jgi:hypothetical protein
VDPCPVALTIPTNYDQLLAAQRPAQIARFKLKNSGEQAHAPTPRADRFRWVRGGLTGILQP